MARKPKNVLTILFIGDVVGKIGRRTVATVLPELREEYRPDVVIANAENLAHGKGVTQSTFEELRAAGVDFATGGNHTFAKEDEANKLLQQPNVPLIRPANVRGDRPGDGVRTIEVGTRKVLIMNLIGRVFMKEEVDDPFRAFDRLYEEHVRPDIGAVFVDFHAETTSEKVAFGWYVDGRASAVIGTHTHVPTADEWVLPKGTAYLTDAGMCGGRDTVIGRSKDEVLQKFLTDAPSRYELPDYGPALFSSVLVEIDPTSRRSTNIERIARAVDIPGSGAYH